MMNQIALSDGSRLILPPPRNAGATELYKEGRIDRLPQWLPPEIPAGRFLTAIAAECNGLPRDVEPVSVVRACFNAAVLGLLPGPQLGHCHLVPFKKQVQLIVGYKGFLELAYGCGFLKDVQCEIVLSGEPFERWNDADGAQILHEMPPDRDEEWANVKAAYCIWHATTGGHGVEVVGRKQLDKLKRRGNVWQSDPIEMAKKTPLRRAAKRWKLTGRMAQAVWLDEHVDRDEPQPALVDAEPDEPTPSLSDYAPAEAATDVDEDEALAADYSQRLQQATLPAAVEMVWNDVLADRRLAESDVVALSAVYNDAKDRLKA